MNSYGTKCPYCGRIYPIPDDESEGYECLYADNEIIEMIPIERKEVQDNE